ncbi:TIR domain-containing protein [Cryptosporangium sp. NPDC051539]|uniref:nSTAND1 domain-containing NTPase n=1 Tax=Cryptosporangium sp. NPDC051539 TaxID=3363962 RepID=UPI00379BF60C
MPAGGASDAVARRSSRATHLSRPRRGGCTLPPLAVAGIESGAGVRVFVSHASQDLPVAQQLYTWITDAGHQAYLAADVLDGIAGGEVWRHRLFSELRAADAVVCVVTGAFARSMWCAVEIGIGDALGCLLVPVRAETGAEHPMLEPSRVQYVDYGADAEATRTGLVETLRRWQAGGRARWKEGTNPYPGLEAFTAGRQQLFFGRNTEIGQLRKSVAAAARPDGPGLLMLTGRSGCGKSSLIRAGLLPGLADDPAWLVAEAFAPAGDPVGALARSLAATASGAGLDAGAWSASKLRARLLSQEQSGGMAAVTEDLLSAVGGSDSRRLLLPVDQAEELITPAGAEAGAWLFTAVSDAIDRGLARIVATARADFVDDLLSLAALADARVEVFPLRPMPAGLLPLVITGPAHVAGLVVEEELTRRLVTDTGDGQALPLLAFTLHELADGLEHGQSLSARRYEELGGVAGALARHADTALHAAAQAAGLTQTEVLDGLTRLVTIDSDGRRARRRVRTDRLPVPLQSAAKILIQERLLDQDKHDNDADPGVRLPHVGLTHEALLTAWPLFDTVLTARANTLHAARTVDQAAKDWRRGGRTEAMLWNDRRIETTFAAMGAMPSITAAAVTAAADEADLPPEAVAFLTASAAHARRQHQLEQRRQRQARRARTRTIAVLSIFLALALVAASAAIFQRRSTLDARRISAARALNSEAEYVRDIDGCLAIQLDTAAEALNPGPETRNHLANTLLVSVPSTQLPGGRGGGSAVFSPDGYTLATSGAGGAVQLWDLTDHAHPRPLGPPLTGTSSFNSLAFSPDGHTLAIGGGGASDVVQMWDLAERAHPRLLGSLRSGSKARDADSMMFSRDGRTLAIGDYGGGVQMWDLTERAHPRLLGSPLASKTLYYYFVAFSPDGHTLAINAAYEDGPTVRLWDLTSPSHAQPLGPSLAGTSSVSSMVFSPDGHTLAIGRNGGAVQLWDLTDQAHPRPLGSPLTGQTGSVHSAFSPDGRTLAIGGANGHGGIVQLWDLTDRAHPRPLGSPLISQTGTTESVAFSRDGHTLATTDDHGVARLWDLTDRIRTQTLASALPVQTGPVNSVAFSPDGHTLAVGNASGAVQLWDLTNRSRPRRLASPPTSTSSVTAVVFGPDGHTLATGGANDAGGVVLLWDLTDRAHPRLLGTPLTTQTGTLTSIAFSPDGHALATGDADGVVRLWDLTDRTRTKPLGSPPTNTTDAVQSVAFSPDGRTLAIGGDAGNDGGSVRLWDLTDRAQARLLGAPLTSQTGAVKSVAFSPDGHTLATGDDAAKLWDTTWLRDLTQNPAKEACQRVPEPLDKTTWQLYAPGLPLQHPCR